MKAVTVVEIVYPNNARTEDRMQDVTSFNDHILRMRLYAL